jgi:hypothetical protein
MGVAMRKGRDLMPSSSLHKDPNRRWSAEQLLVSAPAPAVLWC